MNLASSAYIPTLDILLVTGCSAILEIRQLVRKKTKIGKEKTALWQNIRPSTANPINATKRLAKQKWS